MNKIKLLTIAVIGLLLLNFGILAIMFFHHPNGRPDGLPPKHGRPNGEGPKMIIIEKLHFDDAQQTEYQKLIDEHQTKTREARDKMFELKNELYAILKDDSVAVSKKEMIIQKIAENQKELELINFNHFQEIKKLCKPEQVDLFNHLVDELTELFSPQPPPRK